MALYGAKVVEVECLKEHPGRDKCLERFLGSLGQVVDVISELGKGLQEFLEFLSQRHKVFCRQFPAQERRKAAYVAGNGHLVIIKDDNEVFL